jgi:hypothetical protein
MTFHNINASTACVLISLMATLTGCQTNPEITNGIKWGSAYLVETQEQISERIKLENEFYDKTIKNFESQSDDLIKIQFRAVSAGFAQEASLRALESNSNLRAFANVRDYLAENFRNLEAQRIQQKSEADVALLKISEGRTKLQSQERKILELRKKLDALGAEETGAEIVRLFASSADGLKPLLEELSLDGDKYSDIIGDILNTVGDQLEKSDEEK